jgi:NodT family efflux transporter outer membrane factor (OMF) lipoprotein
MIASGVCSARRPLRGAVTLLTAMLIAGCALKSPPTPEILQRDAMPNTSVPETWSASTTPGVVVDGWLAGFADPQLDELVNEALTHNADLRVAATRVERAMSNVKVAGGQLYPAVSLLGRAGGKLSGDGSGLEGVMANVSWELDLWGRLRYARSATGFQATASAADYDYSRQSLAAMVARSWFLATEALLQERLAEEAVISSERLVELIAVRKRVGAASEQEIVLARADLATFRDMLAQMRLANSNARRAIEVLVGRYPSAALEVRVDLPAPPAWPHAGVPSALLERRPDVIAAERRVAAAFHRVGEAKAALLPQISLTGALGTVSSELFVLQGDDTIASLGAGLFAPLYRGGALRAQVEVRDAEQREAMASYAAVGLRAFSEVENALAVGHSLEDRSAILTAGVQDNRRALELTRRQYEVGSGSLFDVLQQQMKLYSASSALVRVNAEQLAQRVNLYLALGGRFSPAESKPATTDASADAQP